MSSVIEWRPVAGDCDGLPYEVSALGWVRRSDTKELAYARRQSKGYIQARLSGGKLVYVHKLVCEAFHGPRPDGCQCNHKNGDKDDNRAENLEWVTPTENIEHSANLGLLPAGIPADTIREIREKAMRGWTKRDIAESTGISVRHIYRIVNRHQRKATA